MLPHWDSMNSGAAGTLAQIIPVLFIALLFEIRARPRPGGQRTVLGILLGFFGNALVAAIAVVLEFALLGVVQVNEVKHGATWLWGLSIVLFAVVVFRWALTTVAIRLVTESSLVRFGRTAVTSSFLPVLGELVLAPSQLLADVLVSFASMGRSFGPALLGLGVPFRDAALSIRDLFRRQK